MKRVLILVEGPTEERFVKELLQPHLWSFGVHPEPKIVTTKRTKEGTQFKGVNAFPKVEGDLRRLLGDHGAALVTTMLDYYGLPEDFPGKRGLQGKTPLEKVRALERSLEEHLQAESRFRAFLLLHEFEAFLFADPAVLAQVMNEEKRSAEIQRIREDFPTVEDINDGVTTAPSKRVLALFAGYRKRLHGPMVATRIGLPALRRECRHFDEWLAALERIGPPKSN